MHLEARRSNRVNQSFLSDTFTPPQKPNICIAGHQSKVLAGAITKMCEDAIEDLAQVHAKTWNLWNRHSPKESVWGPSHFTSAEHIQFLRIGLF